MIRFFLLLTDLLLVATQSFSQTMLKPGWWKVDLLRSDSNTIVFNFEVKNDDNKTTLYMRNATERLKVTDVTYKGDSVFIHMPVFESHFRARLITPKTLEGIWIKGTSTKDQVISFKAYHSKSERFDADRKPMANVSGKWAVTFIRPNNTSRPAIAEFTQKGNSVTGTFLTPSGDYRYLEGAVNGNKLNLSTFDGSHAYSFSATINDKNRISEGHFYGGATHHERWSAIRDATATLPDDVSAVYLKDGEERVDFTFPDLDGKPVSINDERFKNKVVVVQLMGSWCPNCMDETAFLSEFYNKNKHRGIEVVSLAYEYSTNFERSQKSLRKFEKRFNVQYPMLITGVRTADSLRTEKSLPQLTTVKALPTSIFIGKDGKVKKIEIGFYGPGTGKHHEDYKKEFYATIEGLLKER